MARKRISDVFTEACAVNQIDIICLSDSRHTQILAYYAKICVEKIKFCIARQADRHKTVWRGALEQEIAESPPKIITGVCPISTAHLSKCKPAVSEVYETVTMLDITTA